MRRKTCEACGESFEPSRAMQTVCSSRCEAIYSRAHLKTRKPLAGPTAPIARAALTRRTPLARCSPTVGGVRSRKSREPAKRVHGRRGLMRAAVAAFNAYIRERDAHLPCVSCGCWHAAEWHAGHYMSVGARSELRFDEANVHRQCANCNTTRAGHHRAYRATLMHRIGATEVERLEGLTSPRKWTEGELREITHAYTAKLAQLRLLNTDPLHSATPGARPPS